MNTHTRSSRRGLTLLEILVTMVVSGVVLIGLGTLFMGATSDYAELARQREERYSRELLEAELVWRLKAVPGEWLPTRAQQDAMRVNYTDDRTGAGVTGEYIAYDYVRNDVRTAFGVVPPAPNNVATNGIPVSGGGCSVNVPAGISVRTGMIFQWFSVVYVVERDITGNPGNSFRNLGGGAQAFVNSLFAPGGPPAGLIGPTPIGIGIQTIDFTVRDPASGACDDQRQRRVEWRISQFI